MSPPLRRRLTAAAFEHRWLITFVLVAFAVRLHWNLVVHPPGDFIYSDMRGYLRRADGLFDNKWERWEYSAFYPFGTHVFHYAVLALFGREMLLHPLAKGMRTDLPRAMRADFDFRSVLDATPPHVPLAIAYAVVGALLVGYGYALARRVSKHGWVPPAVGAILVIYYPLISLGGYFLSEVPFAMCFVASTFHLVRMVDTGHRRDAFAAGTFAALGFTLRPQILLSIALFGLLWIVARRAFPRVGIKQLLYAGAPLLLMMAFSAWRLHYHTGRYGLISENGKFNQVFGRCHNEKILALPDTPQRRRTSFGPPPLIQLAKRSAKLPGQWPQLDPAIDTMFEYRGYIGDSEILGAYIDECIAKTGWAKQVEYSAVNVLLLWRFNIMWPDSGKGEWRPYAQRWGSIHANLFLIPALLSLASVWFVRRRPKLAVVSLHLWAILIVAVFYLGGARFRSPYDPFIILLAMEVYAIAAARVLTHWRGRNRRNEAGVEGVAGGSLVPPERRS
jgi:hypothetical protein